jgi:GNAT superfamily N-acetyltransferase
MPYLFRPWTVLDAGIDREISQSVYPEYREDPRHPAWFPARQLGAPREPSSRYVAVETQNDRQVAYASLWELRPRRYRFDLAVRPEWQGQAIGAQLLVRVMRDAKALGATGLQARVRDDNHRAREFVTRRGFLESHRMRAYRLDFSTADVSDFQQAFTRLRDRSIEVTNLAALREQEPHYLEQFYTLYSAASDGWPDPGPAPAGTGVASIGELERSLDATRLPEAFFIAKSRGRYIAFTSFFGIGTAVHPDYRRQGIATQLKAGSIADALRRGLQGQTTSTANPAMQKVLETLGYVPLWSEVRLIREMEP